VIGSAGIQGALTTLAVVLVAPHMNFGLLLDSGIVAWIGGVLGVSCFVVITIELARALALRKRRRGMVR
jgi:hypothetical protein